MSTTTKPWACFCGAAFDDAHRLLEHLPRHRADGTPVQPPIQPWGMGVPDLFGWVRPEHLTPDVAAALGVAFDRFACRWAFAREAGAEVPALARDALTFMYEHAGFHSAELAHFLECLALWDPPRPTA